MPVCEADPWRMQYFEAVPCPADVRIPTEDCDAWDWYPAPELDLRQACASPRARGSTAARMASSRRRFPVFSKPIINLKGMGVGSGVLHSLADYEAHYAPGPFLDELLTGEHVSTDCAIVDGRVALVAAYDRQASRRTACSITGPSMPGTPPELEALCRRMGRQHLAGYTGMINVETIGGRIIEAHLRFADQWPDLYGKGWVEALVRLYAEKRWDFPEEGKRRDGYSVVLFGRHGRRYRHPPARAARRGARHAGVSSVQITFHEDKPPAEHAMPPGGFRLAIVNCFDLAVGRAARDKLRAFFLGNL